MITNTWNGFSCELCNGKACTVCTRQEGSMVQKGEQINGRSNI